MREWLRRCLLLVGLLVISWVVMVISHELGHVLGGTCCGGKLIALDLAPWRLPYSLFEPDPLPLFTLWSGPVLGVAVPWVAAVILRHRYGWFVCYFCSVANGVYLASAWYSGDRYLDTPRMLQHGAWPSTVVLFCALTIGWGYWGLRRKIAEILRDDRRSSDCQSFDPKIQTEEDFLSNADKK